MKTRIIVLFASILTLASCSNKMGDYTTSSTGKAGEILVVANPDVWFGTLEDTVRNFFGRMQFGLPQGEPHFTIFAIPFEKFNTVLRPHRNVLMLEMDKSIEKTTIKVTLDKWATPQTIIRIKSPKREDMIVDFLKNKNLIIDYYHNSERRRYQRAFDKMINIPVVNKIKEKYKFKLTIPEGYYMAVEKDDFFWLRRETPDMSHAIVYYSEDYTDTSQFSTRQIIDLRNKFTKMYIPGPTEGSYQIVSEDVYLPASKVIQFQDMYTVETRGLWKLENDFMGGPFVSIAFVDTKTNKLIHLDGFIYAPRDPKRDQLRQVEAIIHSYKPE